MAPVDTITTDNIYRTLVDNSSQSIVDSSSNIVPESDEKLDNISYRFREINGNYSNQFEFLRMLPSEDSIDSRPKGCVTKKPGDSNLPLGMSLLDNNLHTRESCKLGASLQFGDIKYKERSDIEKGTIKKTKGLTFQIVDGYFADNVSYFINGVNGNPPTVLGKGISTRMQTLVTGTNDDTTNLIGNSRHLFSVEWQGYLIPDYTGNWAFGLGSDDGSYMWLGDHALYDYKTTNAQIKNGGLHGMHGVNTTIYLIKGKIYPIRIQFGELWGGRDCQLTIKSPDAQNTSNNRYDVLWVLQNADGSFYELKQRYYSLVENSASNTKNGFFNCHILDNGDADTNKNLKLTNQTSSTTYKSNLEYKTLWSAFNENDPTSVQKIKPGNYAKLDITSRKLSVYGSDNTLLGYLGYPSTVTSNIEVDNNIDTNSASSRIYGLLESDSTTVNFNIFKRESNGNGGNGWVLHETLFSFPIPKNCVPSKDFYNEKLNKEWYSFLVSWNWNDYYKLNSSRSLYTPDGKFKLTINALGNMVLLYGVEECSNTSKDAENNSFVYTTQKSRYMYNLNVNEKQNKMFYTDNSQKMQEFTPNNSPVLGFNTFVSVGDYIPPTRSNDILIGSSVDTDVNQNKCMDNCKESKTCDSFYYFETTTGNKYCNLQAGDTNNILPSNSVNIIQPNSDIKTSRLYIKDKHLDMDTQYMQDNIPTNTITAFDEYNKYSTHTIYNKEFSSPHSVGVYNTPEYKQLIREQNILLFGKEGFGSYSTANCSDSNAGCIHDISVNKIGPLQDMASKYDKSIQKMNSNTADLRAKVTNYNTIYTDLSNNPSYKFTVASTSPDISVEDTPSLMDRMNQDLNEMLMQQNNIYLMGTVTTASLLILAIILSKS